MSEELKMVAIICLMIVACVALMSQCTQSTGVF